MGKAEHQPQPYAEARARAAVVEMRGTARVIESLDENFKHLINPSLNEPNVASGPEIDAIRQARIRVRAAAKALHVVASRIEGRW